MVGRELLCRMVRSSSNRVVCLVRAHSQEEADARVDSTLRAMEHQPLTVEERSRVSAVPGDLTLDRLGLSVSRWDALLDVVQRIVHGAATVAWDRPLDEVRRINVDGTRRVLELAEGAQKRGRLRKVDYVSTCMVAGKRAGLVGEQDLDDRFGFWNSYEQSKFEAERLVRERADALPVSIYRLSMVVGDSRTGYTSAFKVLYWPLKMLSKGVFRIVPADPGGIVDMVPVDYVGGAIEALSADSAQRGKCFHLAAGPECASTVSQMLDLAVSTLDARRPRLISPRVYFALVRPVLHAVSSDKQREFLRKGRVYLPYLSYQAQFDTAQARAALEPHGIRPPHVGEYFRQLVAYAVSTNWGQGPGGPRTRATGA